MSTSEESILSGGDEDEFPTQWNERIEGADKQRIFRRIHRDNEREASEIKRVNQRSALRWILYVAVFGALCYGLWVKRTTLWNDFDELRTLVMAMTPRFPTKDPLIVHPKRTRPLSEPLGHFPVDSSALLGSGHILASLRYWMEQENRTCMCAHHLVTDGFNHRVCFARGAFDFILMWNMRITGHVIDAEAHIIQREYSQFCPNSLDGVERSRPTTLYVTWETGSDGFIHVNAFKGALARCLQMAEEEMDAAYECTST